MNRLTRTTAALIAALLIGAGLTTACSPSAVDYPTPAGWTSLGEVAAPTPDTRTVRLVDYPVIGASRG